MINSKDLLDLMAYFHKRKDSRLLGVLLNRPGLPGGSPYCPYGVAYE